VRIVTRGFALLVLGLALAVPSAAARDAKGETVLAVAGTDRRQARLVELDRATLRPTRRSLDARGFHGAWSFSPDRARLALSNSYVPTLGRPAGVLLVDVRSVRPVKRILVPGELGFMRALTWVAPNRLVALLVGNSREGTSAVAIDVDRGRIVARTKLTGIVMGGRSLESGLVLLTAPSSGIGPARLVTVDAQLGVRSVTLSAIRAGWARTGSGEDLTMAQREPGLAVDAPGGRAYVVGAGEPAATVDLETLRATYAPVRSVQARAKSAVGPYRSAEWLGGGMLAVSGFTYAGLDPGTRRFVQEPAGLMLLDTRTWSATVVDPDAQSFSLAGSTVVTVVDGRGLAAYGRDGSRLWTALAGRRFNQARVLGDRILVQVNGEAGTRILDARTGAELGRRAGVVPLLLSTPTSPIY
jgi:hypothetical protein